MPKIIFLLIIFVLTAGCRAVGRGIAEELLRETKTVNNLGPCIVTGHQVAGVDSHLQSRQPIKILMIHGIGTHYPGYSLLLQENLAQNLGLDVMSRSNKNIALRSLDNPNTDLGNLRVTFLADREMKKKILFYELTWSEITAAQKQMLVYDYSQLYASRRVVFNQMMKKFLDNALPDAVFYMSSGRDLILQSAAQAMCWMLRTDWEDLPSYQQGSCRISASEQMAALGEQNVVFITHSLGSKIFIDSFTAMIENLDQVEQSLQNAASARLKNKKLTVFMMANQLPLLHMRANPAPVNNQIPSYCTPGGKNYAKRAVSRLNIVAFNDPNDLLTYAIEPDFVDNYIDSRMCPQVTNISVNVTGAVSAFGVGVVNPVAAHVDYDRSAEVIDLIGQGTEALSSDGRNQCRFIGLKSNF